MNKLLKIILFIWQLPQNILGAIVVMFTGAKFLEDEQCYNTNIANFGVSLGHFIIFGGMFDTDDLQHERGHQIQSLYLGPLYLLAVGLPSITRNIWDTLTHKKWSSSKRIDWYYGSYPENWADRLGGVER